jgi:hypothetical protein
MRDKVAGGLAEESRHGRVEGERTFSLEVTDFDI